MNFRDKKNRSASAAALLGASVLAATTMLCLPAAYAQTDQQGAQASDEEDEIVVVGSRIRRDPFRTAAPIQLITREESTRAGLTTTTEILQSNATTGGSAQINNLLGGFVVNGGQGVNTLGLRGFGPTDTLILINGRRLSPAGVRGAVGAADLNTIPSALVDRIEILKDGASSVYGSDAVAGVVNIITNDNLDGFILEGQRNIVEAGGGDQSRISFSGGHEFGALRLVGSVEYYERDVLRYGDRDYTRCPGDLVRDPDTGEIFDDIDPLTGQLDCWSINFANSAGVTLNTIATGTRAGFGGPGAAVLGNFTRWRPNQMVGDGAGGRLDGFEGVNGGGLVGFANRDTFDPDMLDQELITPARTVNAFLQGQYDLGNGSEVYAEFLYSNRESSGVNFVQLTLDYPNNALLGPPGSDLRTGPVQNPLSTLPPTLPTNVPIPAPYATQVRAFIGFGNTLSTQDVDYTRYVVGIRGDVGFLDGWQYDFNVYYGHNDAVNTQENFLIDRVFNSLVVSPAVGGEPANLVRNVNGVNVVCTITLTNPGYGCIPAPALTASTIAGNLPSDWVRWIQQTLRETNVYEETAYQFIIDGPLFSMPAGRVQGVFGLEHRSASIDDTPDFNNINNNVYNFTSAQVTRGEDAVSEAFTELEFPLLSGAPLAESLTLNLSGRYTDYDSYGADSTYKISTSWEPVEDLLVRFTRGTSYRAPALFEQFLGFTSGFLAGNQDPCNGYGARPITDRIYINCDAQIGNPAFVQNNGVTVFGSGGAVNDLSAETSENETYGFTWRPLHDVDSWGELSLAIDRFSISLSDSVAQPGAANIMNICYGSPNPATEPYCALISRDGSNRLTVFNNYLNIASQDAEGYDYGARYAHTLWNGEVSVAVNLTQYTTQTFQLLDLFDPTDTNGRIGSPEMVGDMAVNYERGPWNFRYGLTWIDAMSDYAAQEEDPATSFFVLSTPDYFLHDVSVEYQADNWKATLGVRNLLDEQPPRVSSVDNLINGLGAVPFFSGFDYVGRQFFINLSTSF